MPHQLPIDKHITNAPISSISFEFSKKDFQISLLKFKTMSTSMDDEESHCDLNPAKDMWYTKARVIRKWKRAYPLRSLMLKQEEECGCTSQTVGTQKKLVDELIVLGIQEVSIFYT